MTTKTGRRAPTMTRRLIQSVTIRGARQDASISACSNFPRCLTVWILEMNRMLALRNATNTSPPHLLRSTEWQFANHLRPSPIFHPYNFGMSLEDHPRIFRHGMKWCRRGLFWLSWLGWSERTRTGIFAVGFGNHGCRNHGL